MTRPKLLLADDSVTIRKVVELTFADEGIDVTTVADGEAAMSKFVDVHPDVVLVDVGLPEMNGYDFCEMIKGDETTKHIPVLLLVGSFEPFDQDAAEKSGADGFLTKPFHSIRDLVNRVHELLGTQQPSAEDVIDFETTISDEEAGDEDDINELYERSFAETVAIENFETVPAFASEDAFPEEAALEQDSKSEGSTEESPSEAQTPEAELAPTEEVADEDRTVDASHHSVDEWLDDDMIEAVSSTPPEDLQGAESHAIEAVSQYEDAPAAAVDIEPIKEFDWSPAAIVTAADEKEIGAAAGFNSALERDDPMVATAPSIEGHITEELPDLETDEIPEIAREETDGHVAAAPVGESSASADNGSDIPAVADVTPELIELITRRVIERLSDRAVREVAQEAVPRIAEKLMREALEEDRTK